MTDLPPEVQWAIVRDLQPRLRLVKAAAGAAILSVVKPGDSRTAVLVDGTRLGRVGVDANLDVAIENESTFLDWVRANHPTEVYTAVRPAFREHILDDAKRNGALPPGVSVVAGEPYVTFTAYSSKTGPALWAQLLEAPDGIR